MDCYQIISELYASKGLHKGMVGILMKLADTVLDREYTFSFPGISPLDPGTELRVRVLRNTTSERFFKSNLKEVELEEENRDKAYDKICIVNSTIANAYSNEEKIRYPHTGGYEIVPVRVPGLPKYEDFDCRCSAPSQEEIFKMFGLPPWHRRKDKVLGIKKIIYNNPATVVIWKDGDKTVVKTAEGQEFSEYFGLLAALAKRVFGTNSAINREIKNKREYTEGHTRKTAKEEYEREKAEKALKETSIAFTDLKARTDKAREEITNAINTSSMTKKLRTTLTMIRDCILTNNK